MNRYKPIQKITLPESKDINLFLSVNIPKDKNTFISFDSGRVSYLRN